MDINITLLGEMISFGVLVWFTMKFIWPPVVKAMHERQQKIADGLEAAARGQHDLELAQEKAGGILKGAHREASGITDNANKQVVGLIEEGKQKAKHEGAKMLLLAKSDIEKEVRDAKHKLHKEVGDLAIACTEKILAAKLDKQTNQKLIDRFIEEL